MRAFAVPGSGPRRDRRRLAVGHPAEGGEPDGMQCGAGGARAAPGLRFFGAEYPAQAVGGLAGIREASGRAAAVTATAVTAALAGARDPGKMLAVVGMLPWRSCGMATAAAYSAAMSAAARWPGARGTTCRGSSRPVPARQPGPHVPAGGWGVYSGGGVPGGDDVVDELLRGKDGVARGQGQCPRRGKVGAAARRDDPGGVRRGAGATARPRDGSADAGGGAASSRTAGRRPRGAGRGSGRRMTSPGAMRAATGRQSAPGIPGRTVIRRRVPTARCGQRARTGGPGAARSRRSGRA